MGELDDDRRGHDARSIGIPELGREQHEKGPESLAAGIHQVPGRLGHEGVLAAHGRTQEVLDPRHAHAKSGLEGGIDHPQAHQRPRGMRTHGYSTIAGIRRRAR